MSVEPSADRLLRLIYIGVSATLACSTAVLFAVGWPRWWRYLAPEQSPMTWVQSMVLALCCVLAGLVAAQYWLLGRTRRQLAPFLLIGAGFGWLALDERFTIHERVRDHVLAPRGIRVPLLTWVGPGDFLLLAYAIIGLLVLWQVLPALRGVPRVRALFFAGVVCAAAAVVADSIDPTRYSASGERLEQTIEEVVELASGTLFLLAMVTIHMRLFASGSGPPRPSVGPQPRSAGSAHAASERGVTTA